ncbi:aspartyl/asparaginyl beta-hydroxylase domain-containing protein [Catenulispora subtropica]
MTHGTAPAPAPAAAPKRTTKITSLDLDAERLAEDLRRAEGFAYNDSYSEFICGAWRSCMLWNRSGDLADTRLEDFSGPGRITPYGAQLPYLFEVIGDVFQTESLKFARLARLTPGSVLVPHRDYLELEDDLIRIHLPIQTSRDCYSSEDDTIYQMRHGELWFLDATRPHSAASFTDRDRVHLILDFAVDDVSEVFTEGFEQTCLDLHGLSGGEVPPDNIVTRAELLPGERESYVALAGVLSTENYEDVLAMVIKKFFKSELAVTDVFGWFGRIAEASGQPELVARVRRHEEHCLVRR